MFILLALTAPETVIGDEPEAMNQASPLSLQASADVPESDVDQGAELAPLLQVPPPACQPAAALASQISAKANVCVTVEPADVPPGNAMDTVEPSSVKSV